jgi:exonuclease VII small subunit
MKTENIPADIKSKSLKEAKDEINEILVKLESENLDLDNAQDDYNRLIQLNKHIESLFKKKSRDILNTK